MFQFKSHRITRKFFYLLLASALFWSLAANRINCYAQTSNASATSKDAPPNDQTETQIKVTFDENAPGVVVVESHGEIIRIDTKNKSVTPVKETPTPAVEHAATTTETPPQGDQTTPKEAKDDETEVYVPERYDYRLVNLPTPKRVPKHSINLYFTHRFSQPVRPLHESGKNLLGLDSYAVASFGVSFGITDRLYVSAYRSPLCQNGLCRTIEIGAGYHLLDEKKDVPLTMALYTSIEGDDNFSDHYTYNLQAQFARSVTKYVNLFFSPAVHFNANGQHRFNPKPTDFFPPTPLAAQFKLGRHTGSFGFGVNARIRPTVSLLFEYTPRVGFKLGRVQPIYDNNFNIIGFTNESEAEIGFGVQKDIGRHTFTLTFSNTQTTTTSRYNSSNLVLSPTDFIIGFNLFRRMH